MLWFRSRPSRRSRPLLFGSAERQEMPDHALTGASGTPAYPAVRLSKSGRSQSVLKDPDRLHQGVHRHGANQYETALA